MRKLSYLAIIAKTESGFSVRFPDLDGCVSCGKSFEEALDNAKEALGLHVFGYEGDGMELPVSTYKYDSLEDGEVVSVVTVFPDVFRDEYYNRRVKTNVTIPYGLKELAEEKNINFSRLLESALRDVLDLSGRCGVARNI